MEADDILGTWSVDARYGPGAMEDWLLYFRGDGRGCWWYGNLGGARVAVFDWRMTDGRLSTTTRRRFHTPRGKQKPFLRGDSLTLDLTDVPVTVRVEPTPARKELLVLGCQREPSRGPRTPSDSWTRNHPRGCVRFSTSEDCHACRPGRLC